MLSDGLELRDADNEPQWHWLVVSHIEQEVTTQLNDANPINHIANSEVSALNFIKLRGDVVTTGFFDLTFYAGYHDQQMIEKCMEYEPPLVEPCDYESMNCKLD